MFCLRLVWRKKFTECVMSAMACVSFVIWQRETTQRSATQGAGRIHAACTSL